MGQLLSVNSPAYRVAAWLSLYLTFRRFAEQRYGKALAYALSAVVCSTAGRGPLDSLLAGFFGRGLVEPKAAISVKVCAPGFERVVEVFRKHYDEGREAGAQCCVYHEGQCVVDVVGRREHADPADPTGRRKVAYSEQSIQNIWSSTKVLTSLVVAMLVDRGHLQYDTKVSEIWPEFGSNGKAELTVADVMRHEAGCVKFDVPLRAEDLTPERIKGGSVSAVIAGQKPDWQAHTRREYHGTTRGWVINEVVRRVDPAQRTIGEFLRDEVARPLGLENQLAIGLNAAEEANVVPLLAPTKLWENVHALIPGFLGSHTEAPWLLYLLMVKLGPLLARHRKGPEIVGPEPGFQEYEFNQQTMVGICCLSSVRRCEVPSWNGNTNARAMARVGACIVAALAGVSFEGKTDTLLSHAGAREAHSGVVEACMFGKIATDFGNAGWCQFKDAEGALPRFGYVGWMGYGGSVMQWHPDLQLSFGYAMNLMETDLSNQRGYRLQEAAVQCAKACTEKKCI